ncbi:MAG: hypothetical protein QM802_23540 [Agriterribacter sp.]
MKRKFLYIAFLIIFPMTDPDTLPMEKTKQSSEQYSAGNETADEATPIEYPLLFRGLLTN